MKLDKNRVYVGAVELESGNISCGLVAKCKCCDNLAWVRAYEHDSHPEPTTVMIGTDRYHYSDIEWVDDCNTAIH